MKLNWQGGGAQALSAQRENAELASSAIHIAVEALNP
jgi:hypothetical protein